MVELLAAWLLGTVPEPHATAGEEICVCSRTLSFEDQYCAAVTERRRWGHAEAAAAYEAQAQYALPGKAAAAYVAAANNWIIAGQPVKAVAAFDRSLAAGFMGENKRQVIIARNRAARAVSSEKHRP